MSTKRRPRYGWYGQQPFALKATVRYTEKNSGIPEGTEGEIYGGPYPPETDPGTAKGHDLWDVQWDMGQPIGDIYARMAEWAMEVV